MKTITITLSGKPAMARAISLVSVMATSLNLDHIFTVAINPTTNSLYLTAEEGDISFFLGELNTEDYEEYSITRC